MFSSESILFFMKIEIMKPIKILFSILALTFSLGAYSQTDTTKKDTVIRKMDTTVHKMDTTKRHELTESAALYLQDQQLITSQEIVALQKSTKVPAASGVIAGSLLTGNKSNHRHNHPKKIKKAPMIDFSDIETGQETISLLM